MSDQHKEQRPEMPDSWHNESWDSARYWLIEAIRAARLEVLVGQLADALTILFFKLPPPYGYSATDIDAVAAFWVAELADKGIIVVWNKDEQQFEKVTNA